MSCWRWVPPSLLIPLSVKSTQFSNSRLCSLWNKWAQLSKKLKLFVSKERILWEANNRIRYKYILEVQWKSQDLWENSLAAEWNGTVQGQPNQWNIEETVE
jgi:hypothetical protein